VRSLKVQPLEARFGGVEVLSCFEYERTPRAPPIYRGSCCARAVQSRSLLNQPRNSSRCGGGSCVCRRGIPFGHRVGDRTRNIPTPPKQGKGELEMGKRRGDDGKRHDPAHAPQNPADTIRDGGEMNTVPDTSAESDRWLNTTPEPAGGPDADEEDDGAVGAAALSSGVGGVASEAAGCDRSATAATPVRTDAQRDNLVLLLSVALIAACCLCWFLEHLDYLLKPLVFAVGLSLILRPFVDFLSDRRYQKQKLRLWNVTTPWAPRTATIPRFLALILALSAVKR